MRINIPFALTMSDSEFEAVFITGFVRTYQEWVRDSECRLEMGLPLDEIGRDNARTVVLSSPLVSVRRDGILDMASADFEDLFPDSVHCPSYANVADAEATLIHLEADSDQVTLISAAGRLEYLLSAGLL